MSDPLRDLRNARRQAARNRTRQRQRVAAVGVMVAMALIAVAVVFLRSGNAEREPAVAGIQPTTEVIETASAQSAAQESVTTAESPASNSAPPATVDGATAESATPTADTSIAGALRDIGVRKDPIPFGEDRVQQTIGYNTRHYGYESAKLDPSVIVLHFTVSSTYSSAYNTFASNSPAPGPSGSEPESPGVCTHFVIDKDGTIYQLVPLTVTCRHVIGLNNQAIGIEMVEETSAANILNRPAQLDAAVRLITVLQEAYDIPTDHVIGHAMANDFPTFKDLAGWKNDHGDWTAEDVAAVRKQLAS